MEKLKKVKIRKSIDTAEKFIKRACAYMGEEANQIRFKDASISFCLLKHILRQTLKKLSSKTKNLFLNLHKTTSV